MNTSKHTKTEILIESLVSSLITSTFYPDYLDHYAHYYEDYTDQPTRDAAVAINVYKLFTNNVDQLAFFNISTNTHQITIYGLTSDTPSFIADVNKISNDLSWVLAEHTYENMGFTRNAYIANLLTTDEPSVNFFYSFYKDLGDDGTDELQGDIDEIATILQVYLTAHPDIIPITDED